MMGLLCLFRPHRWQWFGNVLVDWRGGKAPPAGAGLYQCTRCRRLAQGGMRSGGAPTC